MGGVCAYVFDIEECMSTDIVEQVNDKAQSGPVQGSVGAVDRMQGNWKMLAILAVLVAVVIGGIYFYRQQKQTHNIEANAALSRVRSFFEQGEFQKALTADKVPPMGGEPVKGLLAISDEYSGTEAGATAALMAGNSLSNLGKYSEATEQFERAKGSDAIVTQVGALTGLGACREAEKDYAGAAALYEQAAERGSKSGLEDRCWLYAALSYEKAGNKEKAGQIFRTIVKRYEMSELAPAAKSGLARLGMAID